MAEAIELRNITKRFGGNTILHGINLDIAAGSVTVILGPSGSGKSTLLRCINHLEKLDGGTIRVGEQLVGYHQKGSALYELNSKQAAAQRAEIGMVFQQFNLFPHRTVLQNIIDAPMRVKKQSRQQAVLKARSLLQQVGLASREDAWPSELSGGQQQRVAIARALAMDPGVMLFDEPTSALDPELVGEVLLVIKKLAHSGITMVIVTHEVGFAREVADNIVFMEEGKIVAAGPTQAVLDDRENIRVRNFLSTVL
ncbi:amino acid ABC transporter ATP-binding protein [Rouxiella badensis]|jgi:polar amino acid transport system ATP-binding protein|uniref:Ectoine/hydroxyectoine ABC transporter ATP-binding protein EhuA n=1 Tax=Rouxiella badensis TaxID=1646377 RepID=A0A1X0WFH5_9GAMM|nr:amino acid ABC transporter ATP-binding protein [Rouxiella badensis]MCC3701786.1 amino acid ABC transporter ATP-binding protein [Rouxiella badensis]MCC3720026.1 amino acid ABC transporter ATP-binding protein [Rouxiella badensis]MCC3729689.1 amino acid ABC transporter ATP-binding protein [Rouxiella badensis]MCC3731428.1 amino acid ABC transporter ATP-binding protein [Rouxiella badensis]MCC3738363.1 amino acid ABC transporter ATP-binding protein [Rouxiella badensis]